MLLMVGCIGDDVIFDEVDEAVRIINPVDTIGFGETYLFRVSSEKEVLDFSESDQVSDKKDGSYPAF